MVGQNVADDQPAKMLEDNDNPKEGHGQRQKMLRAYLNEYFMTTEVITLQMDMVGKPTDMSKVAKDIYTIYIIKINQKGKKSKRRRRGKKIVIIVSSKYRFCRVSKKENIKSPFIA